VPFFCLYYVLYYLGFDSISSLSCNSIFAQVACIALRSANRGKADVAVRRGTYWLLNQMKSQYVSLYERVTVDVANQRQEEAQKRKERAERVRKMKEERER